MNEEKKKDNLWGVVLTIMCLCIVGVVSASVIRMEKSARSLIQFLKTNSVTPTNWSKQAPDWSTVALTNVINGAPLVPATNAADRIDWDARAWMTNVSSTNLLVSGDTNTVSPYETFSVDLSNWNTNYVQLVFSTEAAPTNMLTLIRNGEELVSISTNGTATLSNTNLDLVSSNFWKVLGLYFKDHYVRKDEQ